MSQPIRRMASLNAEEKMKTVIANLMDGSDYKDQGPRSNKNRNGAKPARSARAAEGEVEAKKAKLEEPVSMRKGEKDFGIRRPMPEVKAEVKPAPTTSQVPQHNQMVGTCCAFVVEILYNLLKLDIALNNFFDMNGSCRQYFVLKRKVKRCKTDTCAYIQGLVEGAKSCSATGDKQDGSGDAAEAPQEFSGFDMGNKEPTPGPSRAFVGFGSIAEKILKLEM